MGGFLLSCWRWYVGGDFFLDDWWYLGSGEWFLVDWYLDGGGESDGWRLGGGVFLLGLCSRGGGYLLLLWCGDGDWWLLLLGSFCRWSLLDWSFPFLLWCDLRGGGVCSSDGVLVLCLLDLLSCSVVSLLVDGWAWWSILIVRCGVGALCQWAIISGVLGGRIKAITRGGGGGGGGGGGHPFSEVGW